jgi:hypothetical protein
MAPRPPSRALKNLQNLLGDDDFDRPEPETPQDRLKQLLGEPTKSGFKSAKAPGSVRVPGKSTPDEDARRRAQGVADALMPLNVALTPFRGIVSGVREAVDAFDSDTTNKASFGDWWNQTKRFDYGFGTAFPMKGNWGRVIGLTGDVALDPLTYLTFGGSVPLKQFGKAAAASSIRKLGVKSVIGRPGRQKLATHVDRVLADKGVDLAVRQNVYSKVAAEGKSFLYDYGDGFGREILEELGVAGPGLYFMGSRFKLPGSDALGAMLERGVTKSRLGISNSRYFSPVLRAMTPEGTGRLSDFGPDAVRNIRNALATGKATVQIGDNVIDAYLGGKILEWDDLRRGTLAGVTQEWDTQLVSVLQRVGTWEKATGLRLSSFLDGAGFGRQLLDGADNLAPELKRELVEIAGEFKAFTDRVYTLVDQASQGTGRTVGYVDKGYFPRKKTDSFAIWLEENRGKGLDSILSESEEVLPPGPSRYAAGLRGRVLQAGDTWFGHLLLEADLNVATLNRMAQVPTPEAAEKMRKYGISFIVDDVFVADTSEALVRYARDMAEQIGTFTMAKAIGADPEYGRFLDMLPPTPDGRALIAKEVTEAATEYASAVAAFARQTRQLANALESALHHAGGNIEAALASIRSGMVDSEMVDDVSETVTTMLDEMTSQDQLLTNSRVSIEHYAPRTEDGSIQGNYRILSEQADVLHQNFEELSTSARAVLSSDRNSPEYAASLASVIQRLLDHSDEVSSFYRQNTLWSSIGDIVPNLGSYDGVNPTSLHAVLAAVRDSADPAYLPRLSDTAAKRRPIDSPYVKFDALFYDEDVGARRFAVRRPGQPKPKSRRDTKAVRRLFAQKESRKRPLYRRLGETVKGARARIKTDDAANGHLAAAIEAFSSGRQLDKNEIDTLYDTFFYVLSKVHDASIAQSPKGRVLVGKEFVDTARGVRTIADDFVEFIYSITSAKGQVDFDIFNMSGLPPEVSGLLYAFRELRQLRDSGSGTLSRESLYRLQDAMHHAASYEDYLQLKHVLDPLGVTIGDDLIDQILLHRAKPLIVDAVRSQDPARLARLTGESGTVYGRRQDSGLFGDRFYVYRPREDVDGLFEDIADLNVGKSGPASFEAPPQMSGADRAAYAAEAELLAAKIRASLVRMENARDSATRAEKHLDFLLEEMGSVKGNLFQRLDDLVYDSVGPNGTFDVDLTMDTLALLLRDSFRNVDNVPGTEAVAQRQFDEFWEAFAPQIEEHVSLLRMLQDVFAVRAEPRVVDVDAEIASMAQLAQQEDFVFGGGRLRMQDVLDRDEIREILEAGRGPALADTPLEEFGPAINSLLRDPDVAFLSSGKPTPRSLHASLVAHVRKTIEGAYGRWWDYYVEEAQHEVLRLHETFLVAARQHTESRALIQTLSQQAESTVRQGVALETGIPYFRTGVESSPRVRVLQQVVDELVSDDLYPLYKSKENYAHALGSLAYLQLPEGELFYGLTQEAIDKAIADSIAGRLVRLPEILSAAREAGQPFELFVRQRVDEYIGNLFNADNVRAGAEASALRADLVDSFGRSEAGKYLSELNEAKARLLSAESQRLAKDPLHRVDGSLGRVRLQLEASGEELVRLRKEDAANATRTARLTTVIVDLIRRLSDAQELTAAVELGDDVSARLAAQLRAQRGPDPTRPEIGRGPVETVFEDAPITDLRTLYPGYRFPGGAAPAGQSDLTRQLTELVQGGVDDVLESSETLGFPEELFDDLASGFGMDAGPSGVRGSKATETVGVINWDYVNEVDQVVRTRAEGDFAQEVLSIDQITFAHKQAVDTLDKQFYGIPLSEKGPAQIQAEIDALRRLNSAGIDTPRTKQIGYRRAIRERLKALQAADPAPPISEARPLASSAGDFSGLDSDSVARLVGWDMDEDPYGFNMIIGPEIVRAMNSRLLIRFSSLPFGVAEERAVFERFVSRQFYEMGYEPRASAFEPDYVVYVPRETPGMRDTTRRFNADVTNSGRQEQFVPDEAVAPEITPSRYVEDKPFAITYEGRKYWVDPASTNLEDNVLLMQVLDNPRAFEGMTIPEKLEVIDALEQSGRTPYMRQILPIERGKEEGQLPPVKTSVARTDVETPRPAGVVPARTILPDGSTGPVQAPVAQSAAKGPANVRSGYSTAGRGTPAGDAKDAAMREVADSSITELTDSARRSSSLTTRNLLPAPGPDSRVVMLARNGELRGMPLSDDTIRAVTEAHLAGARFVVGDMPGVDEPFIRLLERLGANYDVYVSGPAPRVSLLQVDETLAPVLGSDELLPRAMEIVTGPGGAASVAMLQRKLKVSWARAEKLMELLETAGVVGPTRVGESRQVLMTLDEVRNIVPPLESVLNDLPTTQNTSAFDQASAATKPVDAARIEQLEADLAKIQELLGPLQRTQRRNPEQIARWRVAFTEHAENVDQFLRSIGESTDALDSIVMSYLESETAYLAAVARLGPENYDRYMEGTLRAYVSGLNEPEPAMDPFSAALTELGPGWAQLNEKYFPNIAVTNELEQLWRSADYRRDPEYLRNLKKYLGEATKFHKAYAVMTPGFHVRNAIANAFNLFILGVNFRNASQGLEIYNRWQAALKRGETWEQFSATLAGDDLVNAGIARDAMLRSGGGIFSSSYKEAVGGHKIYDNKLTRLNYALGQRSDDSVRFILAYDTAVKGGNVDAAQVLISRFFFDYEDLSKVDKFIKEFIPFWLWTSRNLQSQMQNMWLNPKRYALYMHFKRNLRDDNDRELAAKNPFVQQLGGFQLPVGENVYFVPDLGFARATSTPAEYLDWPRTLNPFTPAVRVPLELMLNQQAFTGKPIRQQTDTSGQQSVDVLAHILRGGAPPANQGARMFVDGDGAVNTNAILSFLGSPVRKYSN